MASSGTTHLHTLFLLHTKSDLSHAHIASVYVPLRFTAPQIQYIPSLSSNVLFICYSYTLAGNEELSFIQLPKDFLVYRCLTILKPDGFSDFARAVYTSAQTNNGTAHSPITNNTHARTHAHRSIELRPVLGLLSCVFQSQRISDKG
jgi:hypothetical protein